MGCFPFSCCFHKNLCASRWSIAGLYYILSRGNRGMKGKRQKALFYCAWFLLSNNLEDLNLYLTNYVLKFLFKEDLRKESDFRINWFCLLFPLVKSLLFRNKSCILKEMVLTFIHPYIAFTFTHIIFERNMFTWKLHLFNNTYFSNFYKPQNVVLVWVPHKESPRKGPEYVQGVPFMLVLVVSGVGYHIWSHIKPCIDQETEFQRDNKW